jgi:nuclear pore complex protein Nup188
MLLEVLSEAVAKGFRSLATQLHSAPETVFPSDFALLTAILQTILSVPEMTTWHAQAALLFANSNTLRYATSLFSWADRITIPTNGVNDPIYGELSILFILSLSSMQPLAESMAVEGILAQLNSANLMNYFRRPGGMSPFDSPARLFAIWSKGILPLCLNLLRAVGPAIAGEISAFLNQFPEQLNRASNCLNSRTVKKITLSLASETHSLALISSILENDRANSARLGIQAGDIPALEWDRDVVKEDIDTWMGRRSALLDKVVVLDERDAALFAKKVNAATAGEGENMLEQRVLRELEAAGECLDLGKGNGNGS